MRSTRRAWILCAVAAVGCQHDLTALQVDLNDNPPNLRKDGGSGSGANGGASGGGGSHLQSGSGGSDLPHPQADPCEPCTAPSTAATEAGLVTCCYGVRKDKCGLNFGKDAICLPPGAPGMDDMNCPSVRRGAMQFPGCCRPDARCGFHAATLGLGCVARDDVPLALTGTKLTPMACSYPCTTDDDCGVAGSEYKCAEDPRNGSSRICVKSCQRDADCPRDEVCALTNDVGMNRVLAFCQAPLTDKSPGEVCATADECAQGVCLENAKVCTELCKVMSDCPVDRPTCAKAGIRRPNRMGDLIPFSICLP